MGAVHYLRDSLINFVTGLGTWKDPSRSSNYTLTLLDRNQLENAYRSDWIAREIVDALPEDATREWRDWQAADDQIEKIEVLEKRFRLQSKLKSAMVRARLYGGGALVIGVEDGNQSDEPLDLDKVGLGALRFVVVMNRYELSAGPRIYDVNSDWYTRPEYYTVQSPISGVEEPLPAGADPTAMSSAMTSHPSRVIEFVGNELPDWRLAPLGGGWGDSVLQTADDTLRQWGLTIGGIAAMVNDAKMDVIKIPDFSKNIATKEYKDRLLARFAAANQSKSTINSILLDKEEEWSRVQTNLSGVPNVLAELMTVVAGAGRMPVSRLFGKAGSKGLGKSSSGQDELRNYYDSVSSEQKTEVTPRLDVLDQVLIRSALGQPDDNVHYAWAPLYLPEPAELATIAKTKADTTKVYVDMGMINEDALRDATVNQLIEDGTYPGLEDAIEEHGSEPDVVESRVWSPGYDPVTGKPLAGAAGGKSGLPGQVPPKQITQQDAPGDDDEPRDEHGRWTVGSSFREEIRPMISKQINEAHSRTDWKKLPNDFERDAVKNVFQKVKPHFEKAAIKQRIKASNASTFNELKSALTDALVTDATPRTLYVRRDVVNASAIRRWALSQGFKNVTPDADMHVTVAFSRTPIDWVKVGESPSTYAPNAPGSEQGWLTVPDGGPRLVEKFGDAVVLVFASSALAWRHEETKRAGASWDYPDYNPHVTITYDPGDVDLEKVVPYRGPIELGPEIFQEVAE